jgi:hypothetical protein
MSDSYATYEVTPTSARKSAQWISLLGVMVAGVAITLSSVAMNEANRNSGRLDDMQTSTSYSKMLMTTQTAHTAAKMSAASALYSRAATMAVSHPFCHKSVDHYGACQDLLASCEQMMNHMANHTVSEFHNAIRSGQFAMGRAHAFAAQAQKLVAAEDSSVEGKAHVLADLSNCDHRFESTVCITSFGQERIGLSWGDLSGYHTAMRRDQWSDMGHAAEMGAIQSGVGALLNGGGFKGFLQGAVSGALGGVANYAGNH